MRERIRVLLRRAYATRPAQSALRALDAVGGLAIRTKIGANVVAAIAPASRPVLCASCFVDQGLKLDASRIGIEYALPCPHCGARASKKLTPYLVNVLASQFFVRGSVQRGRYGSAPRVQFNNQQFGTGDYYGPSWMRDDIRLIGEAARIGFFHYGPRLWMIGHVTPLEALEDPLQRPAILDRILREYPSRTWPADDTLYRLRRNPTSPADPTGYDSPPESCLGQGRLDSPEFPVLYCSRDIEGCAHECRVTVEDDLFLATLRPTRSLKLLDLTELLAEEHTTEFESLDMAIHMLFYAGDHSYPIARAIAMSAKEAGFDGLIYPSYFGQVRSGLMPFETAYGISLRRFPNAAEYAKSGVFPNVALFGRPVKDGAVEVVCINRLVIHQARYDLRFGPIVD